MKKFSNCPHCLRTIRIKPDGTFAAHVPNHWQKTCIGHKQPAKWVEAKPLLAMARNTKGDCMKCGWPIDKLNPDCRQCGQHWARGNLKPEILR